jgi:hypothetical protein
LISRDSGFAKQRRAAREGIIGHGVRHGGSAAARRSGAGSGNICSLFVLFKGSARNPPVGRRNRAQSGWVPSGHGREEDDGRNPRDLRGNEIDRPTASAAACASTESFPAITAGRAAKNVDTNYVYVMEFKGDRIRHMTKIWNAG